MKNQRPDLADQIEVGREVRSPQYGKGFVAEINDESLKVRFWRHGYVTFRRPEGDYPFELLDEVRSIKKKGAIAQKSIASETHKTKDWSSFCKHRQNPHLCLKCHGLTERDIEKWKKHRTTERQIHRTLGPRKSRVPVFSSVRISGNDCLAVSRSENAVPGTEISYWYECLGCSQVIEIPASKGKLDACPTCGGKLISVPEPYQRSQFSPYVGSGAEQESYGGAAMPVRARHSEAEETEDDMKRDLFTDPNSRVQKGGIGYLRIPLDAPRSTRADAPEWLDLREIFLGTLKKTRAARGERILYGFYVEEKTDEQIAQSENWAKDSIKRERAELLEGGNRFFQLQAAKHPPSPAIRERHGNTPQFDSFLANHLPRKAVREKTLAAARPRKDSRVLPTDSIAVCSPERNVLRLDPVFEDKGERFAKTGDGFIRLADLKGFLREEPATPRTRCSYHLCEVAD